MATSYTLVCGPANVSYEVKDLPDPVVMQAGPMTMTTVPRTFGLASSTPGTRLLSRDLDGRYIVVSP